MDTENKVIICKLIIVVVFFLNFNVVCFLNCEQLVCGLINVLGFL